MKALVADDSRAIRTILKNAMINAGFEVAEAEDGRQTLTKLDAHEPYDEALQKRCKKN
jgi:DNA-binding response OmpR family regulator